MEYSITQLSKLSGISGRTLRYYDEIGLLAPARTNDVGYRFYGERQVELLQQILFYRERGLALEQIREVVYNKDFDVITALYDHLSQLESQRKRLEGLIATVKKTISATKGEIEMDNEERFDRFKENLVTENEKHFGKEVREKYGDDEIDASNRKLRNMTEVDYERFQNLNQEILARLVELVKNGTSPHSEEGRRLVLLHKEWMGMTWKEYTVQAHRGVAEMYVMDERFTAYYDREQTGCAAFLRDAVVYWAEKTC